MSHYELLHEDEHLLVVVKPAGLLSIPDRFGNKDSLLGLLERDFGKVFVVHRLDRETSGILCFARSEAAHRHLSMQFEHHTADKYYFALLDGVLHHDEGEIDKPIGEHPGTPGKMTVTNSGKPSLTFYRVAERFKRFTLAEALIKTGRTHQIRVHFQSIGYPLAIDALYGRRAAFLLSEIKGKTYKSGKFSEEERPLMSRTSLHAARLRIDHPASNERLEFKSELPKDFAAVLNQLRKWGG
ncbi:MAG: RluA family pseudouridine synthase [Lewinellaceae bacterium]|nr:RluA family pseudouridine synthase [Saprospiraceae bacterium]MCB9355826.1 RluA family pseudouridine synthase [Lewinellaceae bacterium]